MKKSLLTFVCVLALSSATVFADWYMPLEQVPKAVINTAKSTYPDAEIWTVEMESYNVYEVRMSNMMELYISDSGQLLGQDYDD